MPQNRKYTSGGPVRWGILKSRKISQRSAAPIPRTFDVTIYSKNQEPWCKEVNILDATNDYYHI